VSGRQAVPAAFHDRVIANCWDSLAGELLNLHRPHIGVGGVECQGCDGAGIVAWPCRSYTVIAATMLDIPDVEKQLRQLLEQAERRVTHV
jgi:hypothetical protein